MPQAATEDTGKLAKLTSIVIVAAVGAVASVLATHYIGPLLNRSPKSAPFTFAQVDEYAAETRLDINAVRSFTPLSFEVKCSVPCEPSITESTFSGGGHPDIFPAPTKNSRVLHLEFRKPAALEAGQQVSLFVAPLHPGPLKILSVKPLGAWTELHPPSQ